MSFDSINREVNVAVSASGLELLDLLEQKAADTSSAISKLANDFVTGNATAEQLSNGTVRLASLLDTLRSKIEAITQTRRKQAQAEKDAEAAEMARYQAAMKNAGAETQAIFGEIQGLSNLGNMHKSLLGVAEETNKKKADAKRLTDAETNAKRELLEVERLLAQLEKESNSDVKRTNVELKKQEAEAERLKLAAIKDVNAEIRAQDQVLKSLNQTQTASEKAGAKLEEALGREGRARRTVAEIQMELSKNQGIALGSTVILAEAQNRAKLASDAHATATANLADEMKKGNPYSSEVAFLQERVTKTSEASTKAEKDLADASNNAAIAAKNVVQAENDIQSARQRGNAVLDTAAQKQAHWTRMIFFASQAIEDSQYGFGAVLNNLPLIINQVALALGKSQEAALGWAAAISIGGTAINLLIPIIKDWVSHNKDVKEFFNEMNEGLNPFHLETYRTHLGKLEDRVKELKELKVRIPIEEGELTAALTKIEKIKKAVDYLKSLDDSASDAQEKAGQATSNVLKNMPGGEKGAKDRIYAQIHAEEQMSSRGELDRLQADYKKAQENTRNPALNTNPVSDAMYQRAESQALTNLSAAIKDVETKAQTKAGNLFMAAKKGNDPAARKELAARLGNLPGSTDVMNDNKGMPSTAGGQILYFDEEKFKTDAEFDHNAPALKEEEENRINGNKAFAKEIKESGPQFGPVADGRTKDAKAAATKFGKGMEDEIDRAVAGAVQADQDDASIKRMLFGAVRQRIKGKVPDEILDETVNLIVEAGMTRFEVAHAGRSTDSNTRSETAGEVLHGLDKKATAAAKKKEDHHNTEINRVASQHSGDQSEIEADIATAGLAHMEFSNLTPAEQRAAKKNASRQYSNQAKMLRRMAGKFRPKNEAERERQFQMTEQADDLEARAAVPFPTAAQEQNFQVNKRAERMLKAGTKIKGEDGEERLMTPEEAKKAAQVEVMSARKALDAKIVNNQNAGMTLTEGVIATVGQLMAQQNQLEMRLAKSQDNLNQVNNVNRRPRIPNQPRMPR